MSRNVLALHLVVSLLVAASGSRVASAASTPGSLCNTNAVRPRVTELPSTVNKQHYDLQPGTPITSQIVGAFDLNGNETCTGGAAGVDIFIKSTDFGNQTVCGSLSNCAPGNSD